MKLGITLLAFWNCGGGEMDEEEERGEGEVGGETGMMGELKLPEEEILGEENVGEEKGEGREGSGRERAISQLMVIILCSTGLYS